MKRYRFPEKEFGTKSSSVILVTLFFLMAAAWLTGALFLPVTTDESYYFLWSRHLDLGYFDHPPVVAWLSALGSHVALGPFGYRLGGFLLQLAIFPVFISLCQKAGVTGTRRVGLASLLMFCNFFGCMVGIVTTPDTPFLFAWTLALHEAAAALETNPKRWLTAGAATALGLWSKYAMFLIGPVFLWALIKKRGGLKSPWPYLGGLVCLALFLPHLYWNTQHNWVSFGFQLNHGIRGSHEVAGVTASDLPLPLLRDMDSPEYKLGQNFLSQEGEPKEPPPPLVQLFRRVTDFALGQILLWGLILVPITLGAWRRWRHKDEASMPLNPQVQHLCLAGAVLPVMLFGVLSLFQKIEANWPAIYTVTAAIFLAAWLPRPRRWLPLATAATNLAIILGLVWHANHPFFGTSAPKDRVVLETHGYDELARNLQALKPPLLADSYQIISMLAFYAPAMKVAQWPGITRFSELTRRKEFSYFSYRDLIEKGSFWLITLEIIPPRLPGFTAQQLVEVKDCPLSGLTFTAPPAENEDYVSPCKGAMHRWYLVNYRLSFGLTGVDQPRKNP